MTRHRPAWIVLFLVARTAFAPCSSHAQSVGSDLVNTSGDYGRFEVGNAHRWYDGHSTNAKRHSTHCLSILDEAKAIEETALALDEQARQPGLDSRRATALRKQANAQFALRSKKVRAFIDCFNQANRRQGPTSDVFASDGKGSPPPPSTQENGDEKGIKRVPARPPTKNSASPSITLDEAIDDCFKKSVPNYRGPDWSRFAPESLRPKQVGQFHQSFGLSGVAADQALDQDEAAYGRWQDRELMHDYLVGWLTHCLTDREVLPMQDPRISYRDYMIAHERPDNVKPTRINERFEEFGYGYRSYPLPPFWDHDLAGPPAQ